MLLSVRRKRERLPVHFHRLADAHIRVIKAGTAFFDLNICYWSRPALYTRAKQLPIRGTVEDFNAIESSVFKIRELISGLR